MPTTDLTPDVRAALDDYAAQLVPAIVNAVLNVNDADHRAYLVEQLDTYLAAAYDEHGIHRPPHDRTDHDAHRHDPATGLVVEHTHPGGHRSHQHAEHGPCTAWLPATG